MRIPEYWAEARVAGDVDGRERIVRRHGWSDESPLAAEQHAEERAREAIHALQAGKKVPSREAKLIYGKEGMPIREEVLARTGDMVVTRNSYGARCLNVPDVLFADLDFKASLSPLAELFWKLLLKVVGTGLFVIALLQFGSQNIASGCMWLTGACGIPLTLIIVLGVIRQMPGNVKAERRRMHMRVATLAQTEQGRFALYETPNGLRVMALHKSYDPTAEATQQLLRSIKTDPAFAHLCGLQSCFRARLTAKPWRIGCSRPPTRAIWPVPDEKRAARREWVMRYEVEAENRAACRYVQDVGEADVDPRCAEVQRVHDELSRARTDLRLG